MLLSNELSKAGLLLAAPVLLGQGRGVRRRVARLPEAAHPVGAVGRGGDVLRVAVVGDSVAAGVGLGSHADSIAGRLADLLHRRTARPAAWQVVARSGAAAREVADAVGAADLAGADVVVVSVGVNDVTGLRGDAAWRRDLGAVLAAVRRRAPEARVFLLGLPPFERLHALPRPLADVLGARARRLDRLLVEVAAAHPAVTVLALDPALLGDDDLLAADGFHPGAGVHDLLARGVLDRLALTDLTRPARRSAR